MLVASVVDEVLPVGHPSVAVGALDGLVGEGEVRGGAMPVPLARRDRHTVAGAQAQGGLPALADQADAGDDHEDLPERMGVPCRPRTG